MCSDKISLFKELPKALKFEVASTMYGGIVNKTTLLRKKDPTFVIATIPMLFYSNLKGGEYLYKTESFADEVYIIINGKINLVLENIDIVYKQFLKGAHIGEIEIILGVNRLETAKC